MSESRSIILAAVVAGVAVWSTACGGPDAGPEVGSKDSGVPSAPAGYDAALAEKLGADEYGMKQYVLAFLKAGPTRSQTEEDAQRLQRAHLDNIKRLAEEGKLVLAGPFLDSGEVRGIYVFDVRTVEEARVLTATDPSIQAGRLVMELHPWYGSAALGMLDDWNRAIAKTSI